MEGSLQIPDARKWALGELDAQERLMQQQIGESGLSEEERRKAWETLAKEQGAQRALTEKTLMERTDRRFAAWQRAQEVLRSSRKRQDEILSDVSQAQETGLETQVRGLVPRQRTLEILMGATTDPAKVEAYRKSLYSFSLQFRTLFERLRKRNPARADALFREIYGKEP